MRPYNNHKKCIFLRIHIHFAETHGRASLRRTYAVTFGNYLQGRSMLRPCNGVVYIKYKLQEQILLYGKTAVPDDIAGTVLYEIEPFGKVVQRYARDLFTGSGCAENHLSKRVADQPFSLLCAPL